jgi:hypothetical protein
MAQKITMDELHELRKLLDKMRAEPGFHSDTQAWINGVYNMASVVLDDRRQSDLVVSPLARGAVSSL